MTGAASGMGRLSALRLAASGVKVAALDLDEGGLAETAGRAPSVRPWVCDVSDREQVLRVVSQVSADLGPIDRLVNAAGIAPTGPLVDQDPGAVHRVMEVNYFGTVHLVQAVLPSMLERHSGDVVNFASLAGWMPSPGFGAYGATKAAVVAFTEVLAHENRGQGVRFACVCPPVVDTPMLDQVDPVTRPMVDAQTPIRPEVVIDAVEAGLDRGRLFIFPGRGTRQLWWLRRFAPSLTWSLMEKAEQRTRPTDR